MKYDLIELKSKKIGIFTDLHIGNGKDSSAQLLESKKCINWVIKTFVKEKVDWIIFLGDYFNARYAINTKTLNTAVECMVKLSNNFEKIFLIVGNHDAYYKNTNETNSLDFLGLISQTENITIINNKPYFISIFNHSLGLFPWSSEINYLLDEDGNKRENIEVCDYGFGHFEANGFEQNGQSSAGHKLNTNDLYTMANYLFSGHYHKNKVYYDLLTNTPKLQMVGSTMQLNWGEYRSG